MTAYHTQSRKYFVNGLQLIRTSLAGTVVFTHLADSKVFVSSRSELGSKTGVLVEESQVESMESINMVPLFKKVKAAPALSPDFKHRTKEQKRMVICCIFFTLRNSQYVPRLHARSCENGVRTIDMLQEQFGGTPETGAKTEEFVLERVRCESKVSACCCCVVCCCYYCCIWCIIQHAYSFLNDFSFFTEPCTYTQGSFKVPGQVPWDVAVPKSSSSSSSPSILLPSLASSSPASSATPVIAEPLPPSTYLLLAQVKTLVNNILTEGLYTSPPLEKYSNGTPLILVSSDRKYMGLGVMDDNLFSKDVRHKIINVQVSGKGQKQRDKKFQGRKYVKVITLVSKILT